MPRRSGTWVLIIVAFVVGGEVAAEEREATALGEVTADRIVLKSETHAVVLSPEGIWFEARDGRAAYVEVDKFALASMRESGRHNLASLVGDAASGTAGLVFYGDGPSPRMVVQSTPTASGLTVYNEKGGPRAAFFAGAEGAQLVLHSADGTLLGRLHVEAAQAAPEGGVRGALALFDDRGNLIGRLPAD